MKKIKLKGKILKDSTNNFSLKNKFLISTPTIGVPMSQRLVIYICAHDSEGAMGFIINSPLELTISELLLKLKNNPPLPQPPLLENVYYGGPLKRDLGYLIHCPIADNSHSILLNKDLFISNSQVLLNSLGTKKAPKKYIIALGYSNWDKGELEQEFINNNWIACECDTNILFHTPVKKRWFQSIKGMGIDPYDFSTEIGHS